MPRFGKEEKERIRLRLLEEGARLFETYGLKKVTIDELAAAAVIAKATFYTFYDGKEALFLDIALGIRRRITAELDKALNENAAQSGHARVRMVFERMYELLPKYPLLARIDRDTVALIARKAPREQLAAFSDQSLDAVLLLEKHGIELSCPPQIACAAFQALYTAWMSLADEAPALQASVSDILLNGVIDQIVRD